MKPLLSIVIPMYQVEDFIPELCDGIAKNLNSAKVELIFIDDACLEIPSNIIRDLLNKKYSLQSSVKIIRHKTNKGLSGARNTGIEEATGTYLGFLDGDDIPSANISEIETYLNTGADIISFDYLEFLDKTKKLSLSQLEPINDWKISPVINGFFAWNKIFRRELLKDIRFEMGAIYEDVDFSLRAFEKARNHVFATIPLINYRKRAGSITSKRNSEYAKLTESIVNNAEWLLADNTKASQRFSILTKKLLIVTCKGVRIADANERRIFKMRTADSLRLLNCLAEQYSASTLLGCIRFRLMRIACWAGI